MIFRTCFFSIRRFRGKNIIKKIRCRGVEPRRNRDNPNQMRGERVSAKFSDRNLQKHFMRSKSCLYLSLQCSHLAENSTLPPLSLTLSVCVLPLSIFLKRVALGLWTTQCQRCWGLVLGGVLCSSFSQFKK